MTRSELKQYIDDALEIALSECTSDNPLEAWTQFVDKLDVSARCRIGDDLEGSGRNRYTGDLL